jgi:hypothetical protein
MSDKPMIDELEQENKLLRARNERLEREAIENADAAYAKGWNSSLELAAVMLQRDFNKSFGADTCASWAAWLRGHKV